MDHLCKPSFSESVDAYALWTVRKADEYRVVSTFSNILVIALKIFAHLTESFGLRLNSDLFDYLKARTFKQCIYQLDPFLGQPYVMKNRSDFDYPIIVNNPHKWFGSAIFKSYKNDYDLIIKIMRDNPSKDWSSDFKKHVEDHTILTELLKKDWRLVVDKGLLTKDNCKSLYKKLEDHALNKDENFCAELIKVDYYSNIEWIDNSLKNDIKFHKKIIEKSDPCFIGGMLFEYKFNHKEFLNSSSEICTYVSDKYKNDPVATAEIIKHWPQFWEIHRTKYLEKKEEIDLRMKSLLLASASWRQLEQSQFFEVLLNSPPRDLYLVLRSLRSLADQGQINRITNEYDFKDWGIQNKGFCNYVFELKNLDRFHLNFVTDENIAHDKGKNNLSALYFYLNHRKHMKEGSIFSGYTYKARYNEIEHKISNITCFMRLFLINKELNNNKPHSLPRVIFKEICSYIDVVDLTKIAPLPSNLDVKN